MSELRTTLTRLASPDVGPMVLGAYLDLVQRKLHDGRFDLRPDKHVLLIETSKDGRDWEKAACAVFMIAAEPRILWIDLLFVHEQFRGQGLCRNMLGHLHNIGRQNEVLELQYATDFANAAMRGAAKRLGHREYAVLVKAPIEQQG